MNEFHRFLETMFAGKPKDKAIVIWRLSTKQTLRYTDIRVASERIEALANEDMYFGIGLQESAASIGKRGGVNDITGIVGLHLDIDVAGPGHKKQALPPSYRDAESIFDQLGLEPTVLVNSGHGLQAYFLFSKPWIFKGTDERIEAQALLQRCHNTVKRICAEKGWVIDSVFDLARVMRIPGTMNCKDPDNPVRAKTLKLDGPRYKKSDLEQVFDELPDGSLQQIAKKQIRPGAGEYQHVKYAPEAKAPAEKLLTLLEISVEFKATWDRKRNRWLPSASEYDWSIVTQCAQAGWTDQEIVDALIHWRRMHDENPQKISRPDYIARIVDKAAQVRKEAEVEALKQKKTQETESLQDQIREYRECNTNEEKEQKKQQALDSLSKLLKIKIVKMLKYAQEPAAYELITGKGRVPLGPISCVMEQKRMRERIAEYTGHVIPAIKAKKNDPDSGWINIAQALLNITETIEMPIEDTVIGRLISGIEEFIDYTQEHVDDFETSIINQVPYRDEKGRYYISLNALAKFMSNNGFLDSKIEISKTLRQIGAQQHKVQIVINGNNITRRTWVLPADIFDDDFIDRINKSIN